MSQLVWAQHAFSQSEAALSPAAFFVRPSHPREEALNLKVVGVHGVGGGGGKCPAADKTPCGLALWESFEPPLEPYIEALLRN